MSVEQILKDKGNIVFTIRPEHSVSDTSRLLSAKGVGAVVVCDGKGRVQGVVSERDIVRAIAHYGAASLDMPVRNIMSSPVVTCSLSDTTKQVLQVMTERRVRHLPVTDHGELVGIVSIGDAVNARLLDTQMEVSILRDFAASR